MKNQLSSIIGVVALLIGLAFWFLIHSNQSLATELGKSITDIELLTNEKEDLQKKLKTVQDDLKDQLSRVETLRLERQASEKAFELYRERVTRRLADLEETLFDKDSDLDRKTQIAQAIEENEADYTNYRLEASKINREETLQAYCDLYPESDNCSLEPAEEQLE